MKNRWLSTALILSLMLTGCTSGEMGMDQEQAKETPAVEEQIPRTGEMNSDVAESLKKGRMASSILISFTVRIRLYMWRFWTFYSIFRRIFRYPVLKQTP